MILTDNQTRELETEYFPHTDTHVFMRLECQGKSLEGEFKHLYVEEGETFHSISEFIYKLELMLEQINVPRATTRCRKRWGNPEKYRCGNDRNEPCREWKFVTRPTIHRMDGPGQFFLIHIRYRCNSSWQGEIRWLKKNCIMRFRSVLELLMVLENTMNHQSLSGL